MGTINLATLLVKLKADAKDYNKGVSDAEGKTKGFGDNIKKYLAGGAFAIAANEVRKFVAEGIQEFKAFDEAIREVFTLMPGMSEAAMGAMREDIVAFGAEIGRVTDDTIPAMYQAISAGIPADNIFDFMQTAHLAALGGVTELQTAVDGITSVVNAYGAEVVDATMASDLMFTAVKGGKTDFQQLSDRLFQVVPVAASLGVEFGNITAALASMTSQGVPTRVAATQLRQTLIELSQAGGETAMIFESLTGMTFRDFIAEGNNVQDALMIMEQAAADMDISISDLFSSVQAGQAALVLTGKGTEKFTQELQAAEDATGATAEAASVMEESYARVEEVAEATTEELKIAIGEALAPSKQAWLELKTEVLGYAAGVVKALTVTGKIDKALEQHLSVFTDNLDVMHETDTSQKEFREGMAETMHEMYGYTDVWENWTDEAMRAEIATYTILRPLGMLAPEVVSNERAFDRLAIALQLLEGGWTGTSIELNKLLSSFERIDESVRVELIDQYIDKMDVLALAYEHTSEAEDIAALKAMTRSESVHELAEHTQTYAESLDEMTASEYELARAMDMQAYPETMAERIRADEEWAESVARRDAELAAAAEHEEQLRIQAEAYTERLKQLTSSQDDYFASSLPAIESTASLEAQMFNAAKASGASMEQLAILGGALGLYSDEAVEAAIRTALISAKIDQLAQDYVNGTISIGGMRESLNNFVAGLDETAVHAAMTTTGISEVAGEAEKLGALPEPELPEQFGAIEEAALTTATETETALTDMASAADEQFGAMSDIVDVVMPEITQITSDEMIATKKEVEAEGKMINKEADTIYSAIVDSVDMYMPQVKKQTGEGLDDTGKEARGYIPKYTGIGTDLALGIAKGVYRGSGALTAAVAYIVREAMEAGRAEADASSPSMVMFEFGQDMIEGFILGLEDMEGEAITSMEGIVGALLGLASEFSRAGGTFADMYEEQVLDPLQANIDDFTDRIDEAQALLMESTGLTAEEIQAAASTYGFNPDFWGETALTYTDEQRDALYDIWMLQQQRNEAEAEFAEQQERILELQRQQEQMRFLQAQLDLINSLREAGFDPAEIFAGMTFGLDASLEDLIDAMNVGMEALIGAADDQLGIASPSRVFEQKGWQVVEGMTRGMLDAARYHLAAATDLAMSYTTGTPAPMYSVSDAVSIPEERGSSASYSIQIDARGAYPGAEQNIEAAVRRIMEEFGTEAEQIARTGAY